MKKMLLAYATQAHGWVRQAVSPVVTYKLRVSTGDTTYAAGIGLGKGVERAAAVDHEP